MIIEIVPDWRSLWSKKEVEKELTNFTFNGVGWYFDASGGAMLVSDSSVAHTEQTLLYGDNEPRYWFYYWAESPLESFNWVASAPVVQDLRK